MRKRLLSLICSASLVLCCAASGCSGSQESSESAQNSSGSAQNLFDTVRNSTDSAQESSKSTQKTCIGTVSGQKIYNSGRALYIVKDDNTFEYVEQRPSADDSATTANMASSVRPLDILGEDYAISRFADGFKIVKWDLSDLKSVLCEDLYTSDSIKSVFESVKSKYDLECDVEELCGTALRTSSSKLCDGGDGYVYSVFLPDHNHINQMKPVAYNIMRFAKDGSSFEFTDNKAGDLTIKDGYIYYYDSGYSYDKNDPDNGTLDRSKTGIYKMKTDGSDKKQLVKLSIDDYSEHFLLRDGNYVSMWFAGRLDIVNNELYYIGTDSSLYKVGLDGGEPEKVTKAKCNNYYIDTDSSMLYYVKGRLNIEDPYGYDVISVPLAGGEEKKLFVTTNQSSYSGMMTVDGDYLYLSNPDQYMVYNWNTTYENGDTKRYINRPCGKRWNLKKGEMEELHSVVNTVLKKSKDKFHEDEVVSVSEPKICWEKEKENHGYY